VDSSNDNVSSSFVKRDGNIAMIGELNLDI
jgi:hypothetical protein